jgi:two-component system sensor histidine kinase/response regulator
VRGTGAGWSSLLVQLEQALRSLVAIIDGVLDGDPHGMLVEQTAATQPSHLPETRMLLLHLARLLDEGDGTAIDVLEQSATVLAASLGVEVFRK